MMGRVGEGERGGRKGRTSAFSPLALCLSLLCAGVLSLPAAASWSGGHVGLHPSVSVLRPGQSVSIVWSTLPDDADEFELLLVCESPIRQTIRLTDELDPSLGFYAWRVPNINCSRARIRIRAGIEGRGETTWALSPSFGIGWDPMGVPQSVTFREGEWWFSEKPGPPASSMAGGGPSSMSPLSHPPAGAEAPPNSSLALPPGTRVRGACCARRLESDLNARCRDFLKAPEVHLRI